MKKETDSNYHHGNLKDSLIEEALKMIESDGIKSVTLRELTNRLGTSRSAVYRHYGSKDELFVAVIRAGLQKLDDSVHPLLIEEQDVRERLYKMGKAYISFAIANPNLYRVIFGEVLQKHREENCDINKQEDAAGFHELVKLVLVAQEDGLMRQDDAFLQATVIWSMMHGLSNLLIDGHIHIQENLDALFEISFETLLRGMARD